MVTLVPPELVIVTVWVWAVPTVTVRKVRLAGTTASCPPEAAVPATGNEALTEAVLPEEPEAEPMVRDANPLTATLPLADPELRGENVTVKLALCPAARVRAGLSPAIENSALSTDALLTVKLVPPLFFSVTVFAILCPTATVPNDSELGLTCMAPGGTAVPESEMRIYPP